MSVSLAVLLSISIDFCLIYTTYTLDMPANLLLDIYVFDSLSIFNSLASPTICRAYNFRFVRKTSPPFCFSFFSPALVALGF